MKNLVSFKLKNNVEVIPTSFHGARFNDGTVFEPTSEQIDQIKKDWSCLTVERKFLPINIGIDGIGASKSEQKLSDEAINKLHQVLEDNPNAIIMVSFIIRSTINSMGIKTLNRVVACNATPETQRERPDKKIWDINNFAL